MRLAYLRNLAVAFSAAMTALVGLAQPPVEDRRPYYVVGFVLGDTNTPAPPGTVDQWRADPAGFLMPALETARGWGYTKFLLHVPHGNYIWPDVGGVTLTSSSASLLPEAQRKVMLETAPAWAKQHGISLWVYTGPELIGDPNRYRGPDDPTWYPSVTTERDWRELRAGWSPYLRAGYDGIVLDATPRPDAIPTIRALRSLGFDGGYEPLAFTDFNGTYVQKSRAWYDSVTVTWDSQMIRRPDALFKGDPLFPGVDPDNSFTFIHRGVPYGMNHVVLAPGWLPHTNGSLDVPKAKAVVDDYLSRGWIVSCQFTGEIRAYVDVATYIAARQMPTDGADR